MEGDWLVLKGNGRTRLVTTFPTPPEAPAPKPDAPVAPKPTKPAFTVSHTKARPSLDGVAEAAWDLAPRRPVARVLDGTVAGVDDLPAQAQLMADEEGLHVFVTVTDDKIVRDSAQARRTMRWSSPSPRATIPTTSGSTCSAPGDQTGAQPEVRFATRKYEAGYTVEATIAWAVTGRVPAPGSPLRVNVFVLDDDSGGDADTKVALLAPPSARDLLGLVALGKPVDEKRPDVPKERERGAAMRVYFIGSEMARIPDLIAAQTPNVSTVIPAIDLTSVEEFGGFPDNFLVHVSAS